MEFIYFVIFIGVFLVIAEILAILLRMTGLDRDKARFQVVSIITSTGFTTNESELITQHPIRRKIAEILMIIGYIGQASIIGLVFGAITKVTQLKDIEISIVLLGGIIILLFFITKSKWFLHILEIIYEKRFIKHSSKNKLRTVGEVLKLNEDYGVVEFIIDSNHPLVGVLLEKSDLKKQEIQVLNIERGNYIEQFPKKECVFREGDKVVVYGKLENIKKVVIPKLSDS